MALDKLDETIIAAFQEDDLPTNRQVARRLNVAEGTVRRRLNRLMEQGIVRFDAVADIRRMGVTFLAIVRVSVAPKHLKTLMDSCCAAPEVWYLAVVAGHFNVLALVAAENSEAAASVIEDRVRACPGVDEVDVREIVATKKIELHELVAAEGGNGIAPQKLSR